MSKAALSIFILVTILALANSFSTPFLLSTTLSSPYYYSRSRSKSTKPFLPSSSFSSPHQIASSLFYSRPYNSNTIRSDDDDEEDDEDEDPPTLPVPISPPSFPPRMPSVDSSGGNVDVVSNLLKNRILLLGSGVTDSVANLLVAQLLYLANESPTEDITLYINSPGGSVSAGMAIYDTMQFIPCDVSTVCFGMAASMGAFLLGAGARGKRKALPNSRIMIHQPLGGASGQAADVEIQAKEILYIREVINTYMADYTGQDKAKLEEDCDRDFYMTPEEAQSYGIIDEVVKTKTSHIPKPKMPEL